MSIQIEYDNNIGVTFSLTDKFEYSEVENACNELFANKHFGELKYWIIDRTQSIKYNLTTQQTRALANLCIKASSNNTSLTHIIISGTDLEYGVAHMFQVFQEETGWTLLSFRETPSAQQWVTNNIHS